MAPFINLRRTVFLGLLASMFVGSPAFGEISLPSAIELKKSMYFQNTAGESVQFNPGMYEVEQNGENALNIIPVGTGAGDSTAIQALPAGHEEDVEANTAHLIPSPDNNPDKRHLVYATPEGLALESVGSYSGVFSRAALTWSEQTSEKNGTAEEPLTVEFEQTLYFKTKGGDPKAIQPGEYQVALGHDSIQLTSVSHKGESIDVEPESLGTSAAAVLPGLNGNQNLEMLMIGTIGGQSLVAIGSHDGTFPRGWGVFKKIGRGIKKGVRKVGRTVKKGAKRVHRVYKGKASRYLRAAATGGASLLAKHAKKYGKKYGRTILKKAFHHGKRVLKRACGKRVGTCLAIAGKAAAAAS